MKDAQFGWTAAVAALIPVWLMAMPHIAAFGMERTTKTVLDGVYTQAQAMRGKQHFADYCAGCHMPDLSGGGPAPALSGDAFRLQTEKKTVHDLFTRIRTTMPPDTPDQLGNDTYIEVVTFLLQANEFPAGQEALPEHEEALKQILIVPTNTAVKRQGRD